MKQHNKLLLGFALGVILGLIGHYNFPAKEFAAMGRVTELATFVGATFLRMIFMVVVPLILLALMLGAALELGRGAGLGCRSVISRCSTPSCSAAARFIAVFSTNLLKPGVDLGSTRLRWPLTRACWRSRGRGRDAGASRGFQYFVDPAAAGPIDAAARLPG